MKRIADQQDIDKGLVELIELDPQLERIAALAGPLSLRLRAPGFSGMAEIITSQQVSKASAAAMYSRLVKLVDPLTSANLVSMGEEPMIDAGLSRAKQSTLLLLAAAIEKDRLDLEQLCHLPIIEAQSHLTAIKGIGPWTAEVFLLFYAGHCDIFPAGDVALQHAVGEALGLIERPDEKAVRIIAEKWSPWRGIAARLFWAYYAYLKQGRDILPV